MDIELYEAATTGNIEFILNSGDKIDQVTEGNGETILHLAAVFNMLSCVVAILDEFPSLLDKVNFRDETVLHLAASKGYADVVNVLLNKANPISSSRIDFIRKQNVDLDTTLHLAVRNKHLDVVHLIVQADPNDEHSKNLNFETPLYIATIAGQSSIMRTIITYCKNPGVDGPGGRTLLHAAIISRNPASLHTIMRTIMEQRGDLFERGDDRGWTAFHYAAYFNSVSALDVLIRHVNQHNCWHLIATASNNRETALHLAAHQGHIYVLAKLMECCPEASRELDEHGRNFLHIAAQRAEKELIRSILHDFPDVVLELVNVRDNDGNIPLHLLVSIGCYIPEFMNIDYSTRHIENNRKLTALDLLYVDEDIIGDQAMIKRAFDDTSFDHGSNFWHKLTNWWGPRLLNSWLKKINGTRRKRFLKRSAVQDIRHRKKDEKMKEAITGKVEFYRGRAKSQIVVTALIATVTFTVGFTMPGGYHDSGDDEGLPVHLKKAAFIACMITNTIGLLFSASSLFIYFMSSLYRSPQEVSKLIAVSATFSVVSIVAMMVTFITGTYVLLSPSPALAISLCAVSSLFFLLVIILLIRYMFHARGQGNMVA